jgi:hypothetical protein
MGCAVRVNGTRRKRLTKKNLYQLVKVLSGLAWNPRLNDFQSGREPEYGASETFRFFEEVIVET